MTKILITKSDGKPTKSKVFAKQFLQERGIDESCLIEENGQFFYEDSAGQTEVDCRVADAPRNDKACLLLCI